VKCGQTIKTAAVRPPASIRCEACGSTFVLTDDAPLVGRVIGGHHILRKLGSGGMGTVYLARQISLDRLVAFKALRRRLLHDVKIVKQFRTEAVAAARMSHPNIVQIHDIASDLGVPYITMEYVQGISLEKLLESGPMTVAETVDIARQVLSALSRAQHEGIVHRDIKPANILIDREGITKVADFGLAAVLSERGKAGDVRRGSPQYMSPEHAHHQPVDWRTDLYSTGATLYHMLAGRPPHLGRPL
jgi:serine/threonine-protein kinase